MVPSLLPVLTVSALLMMAGFVNRYVDWEQEDVLVRLGYVMGEYDDLIHTNVLDPEYQARADGILECTDRIKAGVLLEIVERYYSQPNHTHLDPIYAEQDALLLMCKTQIEAARRRHKLKPTDDSLYKTLE